MVVKMILKKHHAYQHISKKMVNNKPKTNISKTITVPQETADFPGEWHHWEECQQCRTEKFKERSEYE